MPSRRRGLALLVVAGVLAVIASLAASFVLLTRMERRSGRQRLLQTHALLLARGALEDGLARISSGQPADYKGEDWSGEGVLNAGPEEAGSEVLNPGILDVDACPARHALRPSFFRSAGGDPRTTRVDGRLRGSTGRLGSEPSQYVLKAYDLNSRIFVNGGVPSSPADESNGHVRRMLGNLAELIDLSDGTPDGLPSDRASAEALFDARPPAGWDGHEDVVRSAQTLGILSKISPLLPYLSTRAWVDPTVARPQPMNTRPGRFLDIDPQHTAGTHAPTLAGDAAGPAVSGDGTPAAPWTQTLLTWNAWEGNRSYPVSWERNHVYAWRQLRAGAVAPEPRAPVSLNTASEFVLAAVFLGLKGTYLETWDGAAGWDGGFGFGVGLNGGGGYPYPSQTAEDAPFHRTRLDYGSPVGAATSRPWYGPRDFNPANAFNGKSLVLNGALGRLRETEPVTAAQARALARAVRERVAQAGPIRTWTQFDAFVAALPEWEDLDDNGVLDGTPYTATGSAGSYARRRFQGEDWNSDGALRREVFLMVAGDSWANLAPGWTDRGNGPLQPADVPGLTRFQKDVLRAMANPNADLNDFNPDANLWKEIDKLDLSGIEDVPSSRAHTTEFCLSPTGWTGLEGAGRIVDEGGRLLALREARTETVVWEIRRDTTQADFLRGHRVGTPLSEVFLAPAAPYPTAGGQALVTYPEPQILDQDATYDGQVGLGFIAALPGPDETLRGDLFDTLDATATGDPAVPDLRGPLAAPLAGGNPTAVGSLFPDGVFSEKDATLRYLLAGNLIPAPSITPKNCTVFYIGFWTKTLWRPETSPRPHALMSFSPGSVVHLTPPLIFGPWNNFELPDTWAPVSGIASRPIGIYFVPARNNFHQDVMAPYTHNGSTTCGRVWPSRSLLWGSVHSLFATTNLNRRGVMSASGNGVVPAAPLPSAQKPLGRLEGHRWTHVTVTSHSWSGSGGTNSSNNGSTLHLGRPVPGLGPDGMGGAWNFGIGNAWETPRMNHAENAGATTPNHLRFGEMATCSNMNFSADATFAGIRMGCQSVPYQTWTTSIASYSETNAWIPVINGYRNFLRSASGPAILGRYLKEHGAAFVSPKLEAGLRPFKLTWTEVPADLWFDLNNNAWAGDATEGTAGPRNDRFGPGGLAGPDGQRDVRIEIEAWDDLGTASTADDVRLRAYADAAAENRVPVPTGRLYYKAVFVNQWDTTTRAGHPLDVTPFLDDVTVHCRDDRSPRILSWKEEAP